MTAMLKYTPEQRLPVNGIEINFDSFGDPSHPPIILIMGLATQMIFWDEDFCRNLANKGFWVIRFDNRDIGRSGWIKQTRFPGSGAFFMNIVFGKKLRVAYELNDMAQDTLGLMTALNIPRAHIVGASMGGMIAQIVAIQSPERVLSLTSIMSTTGDRSLPRASNKTILQMMAKPAMNIDAYVKQASGIWRLLHGNHFHFDEEKIRHLLIRSRARGFNPAGINRQLGAILSAPDRTPLLRRLTLPTLIIHGDSDPLIPVACGIATARALPHAKVKIYPSMGHTIPLELNQTIINDIDDIAKGVGQC